MRRPGLRPAGRNLPRLTDAVLRKRGFVEASLVNDWAAVASEEVARISRPDRLLFPKGERSGGTLHLVVAGAHALEMQHRAPVLVERINMVFGYGAVARIALKRGTLPAPARRRPPERNADAETAGRIAERVRSVGDDGLRAALAALGNHVLATPEVSASRLGSRSKS